MTFIGRLRTPGCLEIRVLILGLVALIGGNAHGADIKSHRISPVLPVIKYWGLQLQKAVPREIARSIHDLVVIDYSRDGTAQSAYTRQEVSLMKKKPAGEHRIILSYLSIGEAEDYRDYWKKSWHKEKPAWLMTENPNWPGNYIVRYWHKEWDALILAYLEKIIEAGFDGIYLDRVDVFQEFKNRPTAKQDMISFVRRLAVRAKKLNRNFYIVGQNAESLLPYADYRAVISGVGKEDLLFGLKGDGHANSMEEVHSSQKYLKYAQNNGLPVLVIEYLDDKVMIASTRQQLLAQGFVPAFSSRALDRLSE